MRNFHWIKVKSKFYYWKGFHENANLFFRENGYTDVECLNGALSGPELEKKLQTTHIIGIRSRTELARRFCTKLPNFLR